MEKLVETGCGTVVKIVKTHRDMSPVTTVFPVLASNRVTLWLMGVLLAAVIIYYQGIFDRSLVILALPTSLLALQFFLAIVIRRIMFDSAPLLAFHFALLGLVFMAFIGQMTYLKGTLELATHESFEGKLENVQQGRWHNGPLERIRFTNLGFSIHYHEGIKRDRTVNRIRSVDLNNSINYLEIGDHQALVIGHYRFYTTHNKGYAPVFEWVPLGSTETIVGSIHLPAFPTHQFNQALEWVVPGTRNKIWTHLKINEEVLPDDRSFDFTVPQQHSLVIRFQDQRFELDPGDEITLPGGVLRYRHLSSWMGYKLDYDWTRPWMLSLALIGILTLAIHFIIRARRYSIFVVK